MPWPWAVIIAVISCIACKLATSVSSCLVLAHKSVIESLFFFFCLTLVEEENRSKSDPDSFLNVNVLNVVYKSLLL